MDEHLNYKEVRWKNFKGFSDTGWIKIKPITIILGSNNAGKTSFLAPLLLMSQTINSRDRYSPLILNGEVYDGGSLHDIAKDYNLSNDIYFGFRYHIHHTDEKLKPIGTYPPGSYEVTLEADEKKGVIKLKKSTIYDIHLREFLSLSLSEDGNYKYSGIGNNAFTGKEKKAILNNKPINFLFSTNSILADLDSDDDEETKENAKNAGKKSEKTAKKIERFSKSFSQFLSAISFNNSRVRGYLGDLSFIGPIRENPKRIYEITNETYDTVGVRGEYMPNLIRRIGDDNEELNSWIQKFGFGDRIELKHHYSNTYSLRFRNKKNSDCYTSIANAGFGASQVLPLIMQSLVAEKGSIIIAEQPEIHLNPRLQCVLAELFVSMAKKEQTIIVETHSEHLLLRLRRLIAEKTIKSTDVAIYFVEKNNTDSVIREIKLQENGHIAPNDWPKDFFGETLKESLALATQQAKNAKK